ncbi:MAG TPA: hypothetical protein VJL32_02650 [Candidatus Paceibacterota bacterium]
MHRAEYFGKIKSDLFRVLVSPRFWLPALFLALIFSYAYRPLEDSDSFYHLKVGELIWQTQQIPQGDVFSYTAPGSFWVIHEWLAELIFYGIWSLSGFWGLIGFCSLLAVLAYFIIYRMMLQRGVDYRLGSLLLFLFGYLALELWIPRPQVFAYLCLVLLIYCLEKYRSGHKSGYLYFAVGLVWLWANTNASFILGIVVLGWYFISSYLAKRYFAGQNFGALAPPKGLLWTLLGSVAVSFLNPSGYHIWLYSWYIAPAVKALDVFEWRPIWRYFYEFETKVFLVELTAGAILLLWYMGWRKESRDWTLLGLVMGVSMLPFISIRHVGFWPITAILPLAISISGLLGRIIKEIKSTGLIPVLAFLGMIMLAGRIISWPGLYFHPDRTPVFAADFIEQNRIKGPFFNLYNEGGYLIWRFWPREKVFIDGRSEVYSYAVLNELSMIYNAKPGWEKLVDEKYEINYFILSYRGASEKIVDLVRALISRNWPMVYWDDTVLIFVRPSQENMPVIQKYSLRHVNPFRPPADFPQQESREAIAEASMLLERVPYSAVVRQYVWELLASRKPREVKP